MMVQIGAFGFPKKNTFTQCKLVEANSKVRKEVRIRSLLRASSPSGLDETLQQLQAAVEAFDHGDETLSLTAGQIHYGRRRSFEIAPEKRSLAAGVDLLLWTIDRYARSEILHHHEDETYQGQARFAVLNRGNWNTPVQVFVHAKDKIESLNIKCGKATFTLNTSIQPGEIMVVDSENRSVQIDGRNVFDLSNQQFIGLQPGANHVRITHSPANDGAQCSITYRDLWV